MGDYSSGFLVIWMACLSNKNITLSIITEGITGYILNLNLEKFSLLSADNGPACCVMTAVNDGLFYI